MSNKIPIHTIRDGSLKAAIWKNESAEKGPFYSVTFTRTYTDEAGAFHDADSFSGTALLKLSRLATIAYDAIDDFRTLDKSEAEAEAA